MATLLVQPDGRYTSIMDGLDVNWLNRGLDHVEMALANKGPRTIWRYLTGNMYYKQFYALNAAYYRKWETLEATMVGAVQTQKWRIDTNTHFSLDLVFGTVAQMKSSRLLVGDQCILFDGIYPTGRQA